MEMDRELQRLQKLSRWVGSYSPNFADLIDFHILLLIAREISVRNAELWVQNLVVCAADCMLLFVGVVVASNSKAASFAAISRWKNETSEDTSDHPIHRYNANHSSECEGESSTT
jgi:hypothetical protein